jgi:DMSO/TMAO reductase YedYZ heme-binding membrane subunit
VKGERVAFCRKLFSYPLSFYAVLYTQAYGISSFFYSLSALVVQITSGPSLFRLIGSILLLLLLLLLLSSLSSDFSRFNSLVL